MRNTTLDLLGYVRVSRNYFSLIPKFGLISFPSIPSKKLYHGNIRSPNNCWTEASPQIGFNPVSRQVLLCTNSHSGTTVPLDPQLDLNSIITRSRLLFRVSFIPTEILFFVWKLFNKHFRSLYWLFLWRHLQINEKGNCNSVVNKLYLYFVLFFMVVSCNSFGIISC